MVRVKTAALTGEALDWVVASIQGWVAVSVKDREVRKGDRYRTIGDASDVGLSYSTRWEHGGPLIDKYALAFECDVIPSDDRFCAWGQGIEDAYGPTHLVAACRAIVAAKFGETVEIPQELLTHSIVAMSVTVC